MRSFLFTLAMLALASAADAFQVRLAPFAAWNEGRTYYATWGGWYGNNDPNRFRSKLDFPLNCNLAGVQLSVNGERPLWGMTWGAGLSLAKGAVDRRSWAADSDWIYTPTGPGGALDGGQLVSGDVARPLPAYYQLTGAAHLSRRLGDCWRVGAGPWYRLLYASYRLYGIYVFNTSISPMGTQTPRVLFPDSLVMEYRTTFNLPGLSLSGAYERSGLRADASVVWMPWVLASYRDDHVLRYLLGEADNRGRGIAYSLGGRAQLPGKLSWLAAGARYEWMSVRTSGHVDSHYYDNTPVAPYSTPDSINLRQQTVTLFLDFKL